jgi:hypothetical protein
MQEWEARSTGKRPLIAMTAVELFGCRPKFEGSRSPISLVQQDGQSVAATG